MTLAIHERKWEKAGVLVLVGLIVGSFLYTFIMVVRTPPLAAELVAESPETLAETTEPTPERTMETRRMYRRPLAFHELNYRDHLDVPPDHSAGAFSAFIPNVGGPTPPSDLGPIQDFRPPMTTASRSSARTREDEEREKEEEGRVATGWGWLADEIATSRQARETKEKESEEKGESDPLGRETETDPADPRSRAAERRSDSSAMFIDASFQPVRDVTALQAPLREERESGSGDRREAGSGDDRTKTAHANGAERNNNREDAAQPGSPLTIRDPFAREPAERERRESAVSSWSFGQSEDSFFRAREASATVERESSAREQVSRVGEYGRSVREPVAPARFGSDAVFHSGGGYSTFGGEGHRSDSLFGAGAGLGSSFSPMMPGGPSGGAGIAPIGSSISTPSFGSPLGGVSRPEMERSTPRTLPW